MRGVTTVEGRERVEGLGRWSKLGVGAFVLALHLVGIALLVRAFAPQLVASVARQVSDGLSVVVVTPQPSPSPEPQPSPQQAAPEPEGAAAPAGKKATPREVTAPEPKVVLAKEAAPKVASTGSANSSGARDEGEGTGAGGIGSGTGAGAGGSGSGGGGATRPVKIAGDINSAKDYPRESRDLRIGSEVIVALTVGTDGRVKSCRISRASPDPDADRITCRLATERFRFRPAMDAAGRTVESVYGWRQRWFYPGHD